MAEFKDALKMSFQQMIDSIGFGPAVYAFRDELSPEYWNQLAHAQWMEIYMASPDGDELKKTAFEKMQKFLKESEAS